MCLGRSELHIYGRDAQAACAIDFGAEVFIDEASDLSCFFKPGCIVSGNSVEYLDALIVDVAMITYVLIFVGRSVTG